MKNWRKGPVLFVAMIKITSTKKKSKAPTRLYVCNRKRCDNCSDECRHTSDIRFALYDDHPDSGFTFHQTERSGGAMLWEKARRK